MKSKLCSWVALVVLTLLVGLAACSKGDDNPTPAVTFTMKLSQTSLSLEAGSEAQLSATISPTASATIAWKSSNESVATVSSSGVVKAVAKGSATITASTTVEGKPLSASCSVEVKEKPATPVLVKSITLSKTQVELKVGKADTLTAAILPEDADNQQLEWTSTDTQIATVANGIITAVKAGSTTITAKATDGSNVEATCAVTITKDKPAAKLVESITLNQQEVALEKGKTYTLTTTILPEDADNKEVTWSTSDEKVATVKDGVVTAVDYGTATITATAKDGSGKKATCTITIAKTLVTSVTLDKATLALKKDGTYTLKATIKPDNATSKDVTWSSSDEKIATVKDGKITAVDYGTATITATATDGSDKKATCTVTVAKTLVTSIKLDNTTLSIDKGQTKTLKATVSPDDATSKDVTWSSSDEKIVTVKNGVVTAVDYGTATITATAADGSGIKATCSVTVPKILVTSVSIKSSLELKVGDTETLTVTISPSNATSKDVEWSSSDKSIASVSSTGVVTAVKAGTATITATAKDGSGKKDTCSVTIKDPASSGGGSSSGGGGTTPTPDPEPANGGEKTNVTNGNWKSN